MSPHGAIIMSFFGGVWCLAAIVSAGKPWQLGLIGVAIAAVTIFAAVRAMRRQAPRSQAESAHIGRVVGWASAFEGVGILLAVNAVRLTGHPDLVLPAIALIVGLHFLPIAYFVMSPHLYVPAILLILLALAPPALMAASGTRDLLVGIGAAIVLWGVSWWVVLRAPSYAPERLA